MIEFFKGVSPDTILQLLAIFIPFLIYNIYYSSDPYRELFVPRWRQKILNILKAISSILVINFFLDDLYWPPAFFLYMIFILIATYITLIHHDPKLLKEFKETKKKKEFVIKILVFILPLIYIFGTFTTNLKEYPIEVYILFQLINAILLIFFGDYAFNNLNLKTKSKFTLKNLKTKPSHKLYFIRILGDNMHLLGDDEYREDCKKKYIYYINTGLYAEINILDIEVKTKEKNKETDKEKDTIFKKIWRNIMPLWAIIPFLLMIVALIIKFFDVL